MIVLDTSALVRFFTNDVPAKAKEVKSILDSTQKIQIPDVVLAELEYVLLSKTYGASRDKVLNAFRLLIERKNTVVSVEAKSAIDLYAKTKLDLADCMVVASARGKRLVSFDKQLLKAV